MARTRCTKLTPEQRQLVEDNIKLAYLMAHRYKRRLRCVAGLDFEELVSIAFIAMCKAATTYDPTRSKPSTYFCLCIKGAFATRARDLCSEKRDKGRESVSLEVVTCNDDWMPELYGEHNWYEDPHLALEQKCLVGELRAAIEDLGSSQKTVLHSMYWENKRQTAIAATLGVNQSTVNRNAKAAVGSLRETLYARGWGP